MKSKLYDMLIQERSTSLLTEPDLTSEEKSEFIKLIHKSGQRMLNTITDIIEISKIEAGVVNISRKLINMNQVLEDLVHFFKMEAQNKGLDLIVEKLLVKNSATIYSDTGKIESILTNLIKNALKYTEQGSIKVGWNKKHSVIEFYIKDTGIGIPKNRTEAIFNRFEQADILDLKVLEGSGLGLAIAKSYVEMLGGNIWVESEEGIGSIFYFNIPYNNDKDEATNIVIEKKSKKQIKNLKILIADYDELSRVYLIKVLAKSTSEIFIAKTGVEALEISKNVPLLDLILMDIKMPEMDGFEVTAQIRKINKDVIIIAQTAFAQTSDKKRAIEAGCNAFISKPISKNKLTTLIQNLLN